VGDEFYDRCRSPAAGLHPVQWLRALAEQTGAALRAELAALANLQIQERAQDPPHGSQLIGHDGAKAAVKALICDGPRVFPAGMREALLISAALLAASTAAAFAVFRAQQPLAGGQPGPEQRLQLAGGAGTRSGRAAARPRGAGRGSRGLAG